MLQKATTPSLKKDNSAAIHRLTFPTKQITIVVVLFDTLAETSRG